MGKIVDKKMFVKLLRSKTRKLAYTIHSLQRAVKRDIIDEDENVIQRFEDDINQNEPYLVEEQDSEHKGERKFRVYYRAPEGGFISYIIVLNNQTRLVSTYRTTKKIQKKLYQYEKTIMKKR